MDEKTGPRKKSPPPTPGGGIAKPRIDLQQRRWAAALRYNSEVDQAPRLVAKGAGALADKILETARQHGLHIHEDRDLMAVLATLDVNSLIPEELYPTVAEILAFLYRLNHQMSK